MLKTSSALSYEQNALDNSLPQNYNSADKEKSQKKKDKQSKTNKTKVPS